jgi:hypothetical protein
MQQKIETDRNPCVRNRRGGSCLCVCSLSLQISLVAVVLVEEKTRMRKVSTFLLALIFSVAGVVSAAGREEGER